MPLILPTERRRADLRFIYKSLMDYKATGHADSLAKAVARMLQDEEFQEHIKLNKSLQEPVSNISGLLRMAWGMFYMFLYKRDYVAAALMIWGPATFTPEPKAAQMMWEGLFNYNLINVMGCASAGKTYCPSAWCLLDWVLDPAWTRVTVVSNSEDHVKKNLFADMVRLHGESALELPGKIDSESISLDKKRAFGIFVLTIPGGPTARGKLKGSKIKNRPHHQLFGENSRLRVILDESQEIAANIWDEIPNLLASVDNSIEHIKILAAANPKAEFSPYGQNCRPVGGWDAIRDDQDEWESETGWHVISINAMRTENVMQKKTIFPRMITWEGVQKIIKSKAGGDAEHANCYVFLYGRFPKTSLMGTVCKAEHIRKSQREWIFETRTTALAANDPAYTGDNPAFACGRVGRAIGWHDWDGTRHDLPEPRMCIQVDVVNVLQRGDTQEMASEGLERCRQLNVSPSGFGIDRTGIGQGIYDLMRRQWRTKVGITGLDTNDFAGICGIHYSEKPTELKVCEEDSETPRDLYDRIATELYFAAAKLMEFDCVGFSKSVDPKTFDELGGRLGGMQVGLGRKITLEGKDVYKARTGSHSPDRGDVVTILLHVARTSTANIIPKSKDTKAFEAVRPSPAWAGFNQNFGSAKIEMGSEYEEINQRD